MLLTKTINNSIIAVKQHRAAIENKQQADNYSNALNQLSQTIKTMKGTLDCAAAMKESGIVSTTLMDEATRSDLLACIYDCGNGVSEMRLTLETVKLLKSRSEAYAAQVKRAWQESSAKYSAGPKGYLSMIGGLSSNPNRARELTASIERTISGDPSIRAVESLVSYVSEAKQITDAFSLNPEIESFLRAVSSFQATVDDLTPGILTWLHEKQLTNKLKIRF